MASTDIPVPTGLTISEYGSAFGGGVWPLGFLLVFVGGVVFFDGGGWGLFAAA